MVDGSPKRLAHVRCRCRRMMVCPEEVLARKLGFALPIVGPAISSATGLSAFCRGLEDLGYDTLWVGDRLITSVDVDSSYLAKGPQMGRSLDPVLLWTVAATATSRVRLNASTLSTFYYSPPHLARLLTTLDVLSDGRLGVGVGLGWMKDEYDAVRGADWHRRGKMLDDVLAFLHAWWTTNPVSWDSEFLSMPPVHADPRPVQAGGPPIWIGGTSEAAMRRAGRSGTGWLGVEVPDTDGRRPRARRPHRGHSAHPRHGRSAGRARRLPAPHRAGPGRAPHRSGPGRALSRTASEPSALLRRPARHATAVGARSGQLGAPLGRPSRCGTTPRPRRAGLPERPACLRRTSPRRRRPAVMFDGIDEVDFEAVTAAFGTVDVVA
ncbi:alkanesulfonate monooxygenase SsuD/methylene tetrahydromethanopterin reductase-like flavin-dependent oxidoreductase (luciferase family) [Streptomyces aurantiacus]|uniref:LLM class flavin-dependent oxidoreductase n=1 Tax=Streptomyces aurantiacus TaxID=47760 RepID=UPI0027943C52|nr:LLM class flavin-dependent oxidoreductase [Streptomyces aurantiacus]MDQ0779816.1 alkanesulfonate monooxygenase SsuD/methylene tetrahydromethanopterin reductase-like flavin-dependent oxidoreductase (luciferase family) [Streptomyces aurantiacus]